MKGSRGEPRRFGPPVIKAITSVNKRLDYTIHPKGNIFKTISQQDEMKTFSNVISRYLSQITFLTHVGFCVEMLRVSFHKLMRVANDAT